MVLVCWVARVQRPQVATVVSVTDPPTVLHLPAVWHTIAVGIGIGRVGRPVGATSCSRTEPTLEVDLLCQLARLLVAEVLFVEIVALEVSGLSEPSPVLLTVGQPVAVSVHIARVGAVEPALRG